MFYDLNICWHDVEAAVRKELLCMLVALGYECAAACHSKANRLSEADRNTLEPLDAATLATGSQQIQTVLHLKSGSAFVASSTYNIQQLSRLTFSASEPLQAQALASNPAVTKSYDVVAIQPKTDRVLQQACTALEVDLISLDLSQRLPFKLNQKVLKQAVDRGIYFEICYSGALRDPVSRRNLFTNAQMLCRATRGRNVVISSGARHGFELRGPYDIINMGTLFGLSQQQAKVAVTSACETVIAHGRTRKLFAGVINVGTVPQQPPQEQESASQQPSQLAGDSIGLYNAQQGQPTTVAASQSEPKPAKRRKR